MLPETVPVHKPRSNWMTVRWLMAVTLGVAMVGGLLASERNHRQGWEMRRAELARQRDQTVAFLDQPLPGPTRSGEASPASLRIGPSASTRLWSVEVRQSDTLTTPITSGSSRVRVSGANGEYSLAPIKIEVNDPLLEGPWLERLLTQYRERGWRYEVVRSRVPIRLDH